MGFEEGIETRELREALKEIANSCGNCAGMGRDFPRGNDDQKDCLVCEPARDALSRPKSSYEQEAELMEKVVSASKKCRTGLLWGIFSKEVDKTVDVLKKELKALSDFRGKKYPVASEGPN